MDLGNQRNVRVQMVAYHLNLLLVQCESKNAINFVIF